MTIDITLQGWMIVPAALTLLATVGVTWALWKEQEPELAQLFCMVWFTHAAVSILTACVVLWGAS